MIDARADVVGSLLRPPALLEARERLARGEISPPEFKRMEDWAVDEALALQVDAEMSVVTDDSWGGTPSRGGQLLCVRTGSIGDPGHVPFVG